jgi:hypothetical protein
MSLDKATLLTMWGFGALYIGLMGILLAINAPALSDFRTPVLLVLSSIGLVGLAVMLIGRLSKAVDSEEGDPASTGDHHLA